MMGSGGAWTGPKGSAGRITAPGAAHGGRACGRELAGAPPRSHMPLPAGVAARRGGRKAFLQPPASGPPSTGPEGGRKPPAAGLSSHKAGGYDRLKIRRRAVNSSSNRRPLVTWRPVMGVCDHSLVNKRRRRTCGGQVGATPSAGRCGVSRILHAARDLRRGAACLAPVTYKAEGSMLYGARVARSAAVYAPVAPAALQPIRRRGHVRVAAESSKHGATAGDQSMAGVGPTPGRERRPWARGTGSLKGWNAGSGAVRME